MGLFGGRIAREKKTGGVMVAMYCRGHHGTKGALCDECRELLDYSHGRLDKCPFGAGKTTCARCPVHCYKPEMKQRMVAVMRWSGPKMLLRHPVLAILHLRDGCASPKRKAK